MLRRRVLVASAASIASLAAGTACTRPAAPTPVPPDATGPNELAVRVPAALTLARGIDTISVSIDASSLAQTSVVVDPGMGVGVESETLVFAEGQRAASPGRLTYSSGADFALGTGWWSTRADGIPVQGTRYVAEARLVLFETDVPPQPEWNPHAGRYKALWTRTLRQAEE